MLVQFGTAGAAPDLRHLRHLHHHLLGQGADAVGFGQRGAGIEQDIDRQRTFVKRRQERARKERHARGDEDDQRQSACQQVACMTERPVQ